MKQAIKFSIIIPFYNSQDYIERALLSVINQTYDNWELIAVNDGSQDNSLNIVEKYGDKDKRIRIITKENGGYSTAINAGLDNISNDSDYFLMLGSDDELVRTVLSNLNRIVNNEKIDLIGFGTACVCSDGSSYPDKFSSIGIDVKETRTNIIDFYSKHDDLPQLFVGRDTSRIYKTSLLGSLRYFGKYGISADGIFSMLFSYKCSSFAHFSFCGYLWHLRENSVSSVKPNELKIEDNFNNWRKFFEELIDNDYKLTEESKKYINYFIYSYIKMVLVKDDILFQRNRKNILVSKKMIKNLSARFGNAVNFKNKIKICYPFLYRRIFKIKSKCRK